jgi:hypothetical protein
MIPPCAAAQVLLETNTAGNLQLVVQVAKEYTEQLGAGAIMELLESHKSYHGLYYYLGGHIAFSEDPEVCLWLRALPALLRICSTVPCPAAAAATCCTCWLAGSLASCLWQLWSSQTRFPISVMTGSRLSLLRAGLPSQTGFAALVAALSHSSMR